MAVTSITARFLARPGRTAQLAALALLGSAMLPNCMCADVQRNRAFQRHLRSKVDGYVHLGSTAELSGQVRDLITDEGYTLTGWDGRFPASTDWMTDDSTRRRLRIHMEERAVGHRVRLTEEVQHKAEPKWERKEHRRDHDLERAVLEQIYPGRAEGLTPQQVGEYVYDVAPSVLWSAARDEVHERGEMLTNVHRVPIDVTAETQWVVYDGDAPSRVRHELSIVRLSDDAHRLTVHRTLDRGVGPRRWETSREQRDYVLEMRLIERRDPSAAEEIKTEARRKGDEAYRRARDAGAISCHAS